MYLVGISIVIYGRKVFQVYTLNGLLILFFPYLIIHPFLHLIYRYTTDGGTRETLQKGTISGDAVFSGKVNSNIFYFLSSEHKGVKQWAC